MPVTHGVAGSSPVRTAGNKKAFGSLRIKGFFIFHPRICGFVENGPHLPDDKLFQMAIGWCITYCRTKRKGIVSNTYRVRRKKIIGQRGGYKIKKDLKEKSSKSFLVGSDGFEPPKAKAS